MKKDNSITVGKPYKHYDIGIVGLWFGLNYGSILTYYALYKVLESIGCHSMLVNKPETLWRPHYAEKTTIANSFFYKYVGERNISQCFHSSEDYHVLNDYCDSFIVGSDVVWNYDICGRDAGQFFFLDFANEQSNKIGMACSFGSGDTAPEEQRILSQKNLQRFHHIGVRELEAVRICNDNFHISADIVMDPVFLLKRDAYDRLADNSSLNKHKNTDRFVVSYILGPNMEKGNLLMKIVNFLGVSRISLPNPNNPANFTKNTGLDSVETVCVEDWLYYFRSAECYVGDSFHGLCFSLIFQIPFIIIVNNGQSLARFYTLLKLIGYENRLINLDSDNMDDETVNKRIRELLAEKIDYESVNQILSQKIDDSLKWLKNAVENKNTDNSDALITINQTIRNKKIGNMIPETVADFPESLCTGCEACANQCPTASIKMCPNADGFMIPCVDVNTCVKCSVCVNSCPSLNTRLSNTVNPEIYAAFAPDEVRAESSSGGIFAAAAKKILEMGGYICGAVFDNDELKVVHKITDNPSGIAEMQKSKYFQSRINHAYQDIKMYLESGKSVLFSGTPCQVAGLNACLNKQYDNLYTMDILCHGVPSQQLFEKYIGEISALPEIAVDGVIPKVKSIVFRDKENHGWRSSTFLRIKFDNGSIYEGSLKNSDIFEVIFHEKLALRKACSDCAFCSFPRQGDISIGDFWGITEYFPALDDKKGSSIVFVNNNHGKKLFELLKPLLSVCKKVKIPPSDIRKNRVRAEYPASVDRERFMSLNRTHSLHDAIKLTKTGSFDVGLVVNFYAVNFGGALTHYALYHVLEDMGYSTLMIERPATSKNLKNAAGAYSLIHRESLYPEYAIADSCADKNEMRRILNNKCKIFMVGSDKLFNYILYTALDKYTSLDWVEDSKKKIAYAASFGRTLGEQEIHSELAYYLQKFDYFSCREKNGVETAKNVYGVKSPEWVLDPVFLCDKKYYNALIERCDRQTPEKYISAYILDPTSEKTEIITYFIRKRNLSNCEAFSEYHRSEDYYRPLGNYYVNGLKTEERLQSIANCDFFVTDSFHGMCFAIIMKKQFVAIVNKKRGADRFYSLAELLHLEERLVESTSQLTELRFSNTIDYEKVYEKLEIQKQRCLNWLSSALLAPKIPVSSEYDILYRIIENQNKKIAELSRKIAQLSSNTDISLSDKTEILTYLDCLKFNLAGNIVVIAVKDTPGLALSKTVAKHLQSLGLSTNLSNQHAHSYICVLNGGHVIFEKLGKNEEPTSFQAHFRNNDIDILSCVYRNGNTAKILINNTDYSVNSRGINIVVYNKKTRKLLDSVCFDTHVEQFTCLRKTM